MGKLDDQVRARVVKWIEGNRITQAEFGRRIGRNDSWVTRWLGNNHDADLDTIQLMAAAFDHSLAELLDLRPDPKERALIDAYRALLPEKRELVIQFVEAMVLPTPHARRKSSR